MRVDVAKSLSDQELERSLKSRVAHYRAATAALLIDLAEFDARKLYLPAGFASMHAYCVGELGFSDDEAYKRIRVARAAKAVPALLVAFSEGRVHLTAARMIAPHLTLENAEELLRAAKERNKLELELWLARRFREADDTGLQFRAATVPAPVPPQLVPGPVEFVGEFADFDPNAVVDGAGGISLATPNSSANQTPTVEPSMVGVEFSTLGAAPSPTSNPTLDSPPRDERILLKLALDRTTHEKLEYARLLLGHTVPSGDVGRVLDRALDVLIAKLEKQKFAATKRPRAANSLETKRPRVASSSATRRSPVASSPETTAPAPSTTVHEGSTQRVSRYVPAAVRRAVWARDGGRCTFLSANGRRCGSRHQVEFHHVRPFARGGPSTVEGLALRCRAHNQFEGERDFGVEFMAARRNDARAQCGARGAPVAPV